MDPNSVRTLLVATKIDRVEQKDTLVAMCDDFHHTYKFDKDKIFFVGNLDTDCIDTNDTITNYTDKLKELLPQLKDCLGLDPLVDGLVSTQNENIYAKIPTHIAQIKDTLKSHKL